MSERPTIRNLLNGLSDRGLMDVARAIAQQHHVTVEEILSDSRKKQYTKARHALIRLLTIDKGMPDTFVGQVLGLNSSTVRSVRRGRSKS